MYHNYQIQEISVQFNINWAAVLLNTPSTITNYTSLTSFLTKNYNIILQTEYQTAQYSHMSNQSRCFEVIGLLDQATQRI